MFQREKMLSLEQIIYLRLNTFWSITIKSGTKEMKIPQSEKVSVKGNGGRE